MIPYNINPKSRGINGFGVSPPDNVWRVQFDAGVEATVTVPGDLPLGVMGAIGRCTPDAIAANNPAAHNRYIARFNYGIENAGDVWVALGATATAPSTNAFVKGAAQLFPDGWEVKSGDVIHAICDKNDQTMSVWFEHITD